MTSGDPSGGTGPIPRPILAWGLAGLIPFLGLPVLALAVPDLSGWSDRALGLYAAVILSFLGGARWGRAVSGPAPDLRTVAISMAPSVVAWGLALLVLPHAYGDGRWGLNLWEATGYVGIPALALAVAAPLRRRGVVLFAVLAVLGAWLSLGDRAPLGLHWLFYKFLPGYGSFRVPTRGLLVTAFAMAMLSAEGLDALRRDPTRGRTRCPHGQLPVTCRML